MYLELPASSVYFSTYEYVKKTLWKNNDDDKSLNPFKSILAGASAGISYWLVGMPMDTLKSCYQTAPEGSFKNLIDVYRELTKLNGFKALYRGLIPVLIRTIPSNGACFLGYEFVVYTFSKLV